MATIKQELPEAPVPFCAFCLREKPSNVEFYKHVVGSTAELRQSFQSMLGYDFQLVNFSICHPCWKLMQLVQDFRLRCFKASSLVERMGEGLRRDDDWFSAKNLATIEAVRMVVKDQVVQIGRAEVSRDDLKSTEVESMTQLVSMVEVGGIKIESVVSLNAEALKEDLAKDTGVKSACSDERKNLSECNKCGRVFSKETILRMHFSSCIGRPASNVITCQICSATFIHSHQFEGHINKHLGKAPFRCRKNCTKGFASVVHRRSHEPRCAKDERQCILCKEKLGTSERLKEHYNLVHPEEKKYACNLCDTRFSKRHDLKVHMQLKHAQSAPKYPCPICGKLFTVRYNVKPHVEQVHDRQRDHQCDICQKRLTNRTCLRVHVARFHRRQLATTHGHF